ncbi:MAG TPA: DNA repair protein RecN [Terriglobales bacterium]|nr:DNA repair protein RecN [Terriglobales bacterium]
MLTELRVENYAVIDSVVVEFASGLNLLTGETGAGKSILIGALALLLGEKASADVIRHGTDKAVVSAVFELSPAEAKALGRTFEENGIDLDGEQVIVRREIQANGRGRVFVSNQPATVAVLKMMAPVLASVHAQRESILSFDAQTRLELLDGFAGADLATAAEAFAAWKSLLDRIAELERDEQDRLRMVDLWSFQKKEIESAGLTPGEDEKLEAEKKILANAEKIYAAAQAAHEALYESSESAAASIRVGYRHLQEVAKYDATFAEALAQLESARIAVEDIGATLRDYAESVNVSPERLGEVEDRLALIDRLRRKYGATVEEVVAYGDDISRKLNEIENKDEVVRRLRQELGAVAQRYLVAARELSKRRYEAARRLEKLVEAEVNDLAMKVRFKVDVSGTDDKANWTMAGFDQVQYLIATNAGEPLRPLEEIASGGELSRVMLALKVAVETGSKNPTQARRRLEWGTQNHSSQRTLVFDEIDIGIGGSAAEAVGRKLKTLSQANQVICITHLPQIASFADQHYLIEKREAEGRTRTSVRRLTDAGRREEIARMLSGAKLTEASRKHAEQLIKANA